MTRLQCEAPIEAARLADYWLAESPASEETVIEEHLLGCEHCSRELQEIAALADAILLPGA